MRKKNVKVVKKGNSCFQKRFQKKLFHRFFAFTEKVIFLLLLVFCIHLANAQELVGIEKVGRNMYKVPLDKYDMKVRIGSPVSDVKTETERLGGELGVNGGFFCPDEKGYSRCTPNATDNERIVDGIVYAPNSGNIDMQDRGLFGVDRNGEAFLVQTSSWQRASNINSGKIQEIAYGIANFPILLANGEDQLENYDVARIGYAKNTQPMGRMIICKPASGNYIIVGYTPKMTIYELPWYLKSTYGCHDALNLDAGRSSAIYYQGKYTLGPGRKVVDGYVFVPKDWRVEKQLSAYVMTKSEVKKTLALYKKILRDIKKGWVTKEEAIKTLQAFETSSYLRANIPARAKYRVIISLLARK